MSVHEADVWMICMNCASVISHQACLFWILEKWAGCSFQTVMASLGISSFLCIYSLFYNPLWLHSEHTSRDQPASSAGMRRKVSQPHACIAHRPVARMELHPETGPQTIFSFTSTHPPVDHPHHFSTGSDAQLGGLTTADLKLIPAQPPAEPTASSQPSYSHMAFYGYMSTAVPPTHAGKIRTGFAGFRNTSRSTLFGQDTWDLDMATHLRIVVAYRGWEGWRNRWVVNIGVDDRPK